MDQGLQRRNSITTFKVNFSPDRKLYLRLPAFFCHFKNYLGVLKRSLIELLRHIDMNTSKIIISIFSLCLIFLFNGDLKAQENKTIQKADAVSESTTHAKSLLWEITGKDLAKPSYLYGTIHMIPKEDFFITSSTEKAFEEVEQVTFEIDMDEMNDITALFSLLGQLMMKDGKTIKDLLNEEDYTLVKNHFEALGLPFFLFDKVKPMILTTFASGDLGSDMSSGKIVSYEMEFNKMAEKKEMETFGLETMAFQMSVFDSIPYQAQADMLVASVKAETQVDTTSNQFDEMVELYKAQDIDGMVSYMSGEEGFDSYEDVLLTLRNKNWIPIMEGMMMKKPTFFAVGAGHLAGENGVISLLEKRGYTLTPKP